MEGIVKSAARVLELFEYFAYRREPLTLSEVVEGLGYPVSSASVLLKSLHKLGYLDYDRGRRVYVPTIRFSVLGTWIHEDMFAEDGDLICLMDTLRTQTGETILLGMQNDLQVQYLRILQSPEAIRFTIKPGTSRPICVAALGKALLSVQPEAHVSVLLRRHNAAQADSAVRLPARDFMEELREARRVGYANTEGNVVPGGAVVGMVLPTRPGQRALALGVGGPVERMRVHRSKIIGMMQAAIADFMHGASGLGHRLELATHGSIARPKKRG